MSGDRDDRGTLGLRRPRVPTRRRDWRLLVRTVGLVLGIPAYALVAVAGAVGGLTLIVAGQNPSLVADVVVGGSLPLAARATVLVELYPFVGTSYGPFAGALLLAVAALVGVDVALVSYHVREHGLGARQGAAGTAGAALGALGAGCGACGTVILSGLLSLAGATGLLTLLPLEGLELSLLAAGVLVLSVYWLTEGLRDGEVRGCPVDVE